MALLEVKDLVKWYGKRNVVKGVSFHVNKGEVVGLLGPNGAGKTTSFRMTTGQIVPNEGTVLFNDQDVTSMPMFKRARLGMGYLTQEQSVFRKLTVEKNLLAILEALPRSRSLGRKLYRSERWQRTEEMLKRFNLEKVRYTSAARASGGEKRRLEIARCLVCEPLLILLDEPFAAVDPITTEDIRKNIRELAQQGIAILLTDHNVREVLKITDRSYLIKDGSVITHGTPQQLIHDPIAIKEYLGTTFNNHIYDDLGHVVSVPRGAPNGPVSIPATAGSINAGENWPQDTGFVSASSDAQSIHTYPPKEPIGYLDPPRASLTANQKKEPLASPSHSYPAPQAKVLSHSNSTNPPNNSQPAPTIHTKETSTLANTPEYSASPRQVNSYVEKMNKIGGSNPLTNGTPTSTMTQSAGGIEQFLLQEKMIRLLEQLRSNDRAQLGSASAELLKQGPSAIPILLDGLERRDRILRDRICLLLGKIVGESPAFDPSAPEEDCRKAIAYLRQRYLQINS